MQISNLLEGMMIFVFIGTILLNTHNTSAQQGERESTKEDRTSVAMTVYNIDLGLVRERRSMQLPSGTVRLRFMDVPEQIDPTTVHVQGLSPTSNVSVLEQQYEFDLLTPTALLEHYVGKEVTLVDRRMVDNTEQVVRQPAILLANNQGQLVWRIGDEIVVNPRYSEIHFPDVPEGLRTRPTLVWLLSSARAGQHDMEVSYLTSGINWRVDYILQVNSENTLGNLKGWVTITNKSGAEYQNAKLNLIAGDVRRVAQQPPSPRRFEMVQAMAAAKAPEEQFAEQAFFEYHLYTLERPATIGREETKQISLLAASGIKLAKEYVINGQRYYYRQQFQPGEPIKEQVEVALSFRNTDENHLGKPFPAGIVRVYQSDEAAGEQFVGEDRIQHTPKDEKVRVRVGSAFDIVAERKQMDYKAIARRIFEYEYELTLRNRKKEKVTVLVNEPIEGDWEVLNANFPWEKTAANAAQFTVPVDAESEAKLVYRVRVRYQ
jgi:hypothetical protein